MRYKIVSLCTGLALLFCANSSHACACCLNGPAFGVTQGLHQDYHSHHVENVSTAISVLNLNLDNFIGADESVGFVLSRPKARLERFNSIHKLTWKLTLTETVNAKRQTLVLHLLARPVKNWTMVAISQPPTAKTVGTPQSIDYAYQVPVGVRVVSDSAKLVQTAKHIDGTLVFRGKGGVCDSILDSVMLHLAFKDASHQRIGDLSGEALMP